MLSLFVDTNSTLAMMISMVLKQQMLPVLQRIAGNTFVFQQDNAIGDSRRHQTSSLLISGRQTARTWTQSTTVFVKWWSNRFTRDHEAMVDSVVDEAVGEWRSPLRACLKVKGRHFRTLAVIDWFLSEPPTFPRRRSYFSSGCVNKIDVAVRYESSGSNDSFNNKAGIGSSVQDFVDEATTTSLASNSEQSGAQSSTSW